jgi:hypothetical protein
VTDVVNGSATFEPRFFRRRQNFVVVVIVVVATANKCGQTSKFNNICDVVCRVKFF